MNSIAGSRPFIFSTTAWDPLIYKSGHVTDLSIPLERLKEFKQVLESITGSRSIFTSTDPFMHQPSHVSDLFVPLESLKEFKSLLEKIVKRDPFLIAVESTSLPGPARTTMVQELYVPLGHLKEYEKILDRVIEKLERKNKLES